MELENILDEITSINKDLINIIEQKNRSNDHYINDICEDIFITAFNKIFKCNFKNLNYSNPNATAVDLFDSSSEKKIIIQVTSDNKPQKLYDTIGKLALNIDEYKDYKKLYHFILKRKSSSYNQNKIDEKIGTNTNIVFNKNEQVIDVYDIVKLLRNEYSNGLSLSELIEIKESLENSLKGINFTNTKLKKSEIKNFIKSNYLIEDEKAINRKIINLKTNEELNFEELFSDDLQYVFLKSSPGMGKSYSLNSFSFKTFEKAILDINNITPFFLNLKEINSKVDLKDEIIKYFHKRKNPLLILDGLDEINDTVEQTSIEQNIFNYLKTYKNVKCIISSRYGLNTIEDVQFNDQKSFVYFDFLKLTEDQIIEYLNNKGIYKQISSDSNYAKLKSTFEIPFNLFQASEYFKKNNKLENSMNFIHNKRINEDILKNCKSSNMLALKARIFIEKLSFISTLIDNKKIPNRELGKMINFDESLYKVLQKEKLLYFEKVNETWEFNNNNKFYEDLLVAYFLQNVDTNKIFELFTIDQDEIEIPNQWFNSIKMLVQIKGPNSDFSKLILSNHQYVLINSEDFGLLDSEKSQIFQKIFNTYEDKDIWIDQQKYDNDRFAKFGNTDENFSFLIEKIKSINIRTKIKAISLLQKFTSTKGRADIIFSTLYEEIKNTTNEHLIWESYYCFSNYVSFYTTEERKKLIDLCVKSEINFKKNNEYIRSSIYRFIYVSNLQEDYLNFMFDGLKFLTYLNKGKIDGRSDISLMDEGYNLDKLFFKIKSPDLLVEALQNIIYNYKDFSNFHTENIYTGLIDNLKEIINLKKTNKIIISRLIEIFSMSYFLKDNWYYHWLEMMSHFNIAIFITETLQCEREILKNLINEKEIFKQHLYHPSNQIAKLITKKSFPEIIIALENGKIEFDSVKKLYFLVKKLDNNTSSIIENKLNKKGYKIQPADHEMTQEEVEQFQKEKFNTLFDIDKFKMEILSFFKNADTIEFPFIENPDWYIGNFYHNNIIISFLKQINNTSLTKNEIEKYFKKNFEEDIVEFIFEQLNKFGYQLTNKQARYLIDWTLFKSKGVDFKNGIFNVSGNNFNYNTECARILKHKQKLGISFDKKTTLDLLSFIDINGSEDEYFETIVEEINDMNLVAERIEENLKSKISYFPILNFHIDFSVKNNFTENYPLIEENIKFILNDIKNEIGGINSLLLYFSKTKNIEFLKDNFPTEISNSFWKAINVLIENGNFSKLVEEKLYYFFENCSEIDKLEICSLLIKNNSDKSLELLSKTLKSIKENKTSVKFRFRDLKIMDYKNEEIQAAIDIIKLSYEYDFDEFHNPVPIMFKYFEQLIIKDKNNYSKILKEINALIKKEKGITPNIEFLETYLSTIKSTYFSYYKINYSLKSVLKIVTDLEN